MKVFVETERLILREMLPEDEKGMFELDSDPEVHRYLGNNPVKSIDQVRNIINSVRLQYKENGIGRWAVIEKASNEFIGWTGLRLIKEEINHHKDFYDVGYRLIRRYWGKGYATETAIASLQYGFKEMNLTVIYAMADINNKGSNNVLRKSGLQLIESFLYEGIQHNWSRIYRDAWVAGMQ